METSKQFLSFNCVMRMMMMMLMIMMMMVVVVRVAKATKTMRSFLSSASRNKKQAKWTRSHLFERRSREKFFFLTYELNNTGNTQLNNIVAQVPTWMAHGWNK